MSEMPDLAAILSRADGETAHLELARPTPFDEAADEDPRAFLWWLLRMAETTHRRAIDALDVEAHAERLRRLEEVLADRPSADADHAQMSCDGASTLRRARVLADLARSPDARILAVGDDDAVTLALAMLGHRSLAAVDVDARLLRWLGDVTGSLGSTVRTTVVDVFDEEPPADLRDACDVVVTDPPRSHDECLGFMRFAAACLRGPASRLCWADHPDWNFEHAAVVAALPGLGLRVERVHDNLHAYPLSAAWLPDADDKARELGVDAAWLRGLLEHTRAWTHLYVLAPA